MPAEKAIHLNDQIMTYRIYEIASLLVFVLPVFMIALLELKQTFLYAHILFAHIVAFGVAMARYNHKQVWWQFDVELALGLAIVDLIARFYTPPIVYTINNTIIFSALILFLYRQTRLPLLKNAVFLIGYSLAYFGLNYKLLDFSHEGFFGIAYSIVLSIYFAFSLLAAGKLRNLYRATFCAGMALLSVIILAKRVYADLFNPVIVLQAADSCLLAYCFIHWNSGRHDAAAVFGKTFFNVGLLPNSLLFVSVMCYSFFSDIISPRYAILGLVMVVFVWYMIFAFKGLWPVFNKKQDGRRLPVQKEIAFCFSNSDFFRNYLTSITQ